MNNALSMTVLPMYKMALNYVPSWFQFAMARLIADMATPLTLPTAEQINHQSCVGGQAPARLYFV